ncbi:MAG TPA: heavy-metal-associated domain-containing protein [Cytophagaceae bacterium]|jgi:mercuric ion binding protein|nr:heavy-metal-associated domain-containing protein [Cytophagaceae bacterium]
MNYIKNFSYIIVLSSFTILMFSCNQPQPKVGKDTSFYVRGNCAMCKERIEKSLTNKKGIIKSSWDVETKNLTVTYDSTKINEGKIQQIVANAGHETKTVVSPQAVHDALPECCKKSGTM